MEMQFNDAVLYSLLGIAIVFFALCLLMCIIYLMNLFTGKTKQSSPTAEAVPAAAPAPVLAPGAAGDLRLYDTEPRTAAMLMAIVADELQVPINQLRFISIREIKEQD